MLTMISQLLEFGVECNSEQAAEILGKFANTKPGCITFGEFFFELMGFPHDFFTMNLCDAKPGEIKGQGQALGVLLLI